MIEPITDPMNTPEKEIIGKMNEIIRTVNLLWEYNGTNQKAISTLQDHVIDELQKKLTIK